MNIFAEQHYNFRFVNAEILQLFVVMTGIVCILIRGSSEYGHFQFSLTTIF